MDDKDVDSEEATATQAPSDHELFIGLVGPIGVDLDAVTDELTKSLATVDYYVQTVRITDVLQQLDAPRQICGINQVTETPADARIHELMTFGNELCAKTGLEDAMALLGVIGVQAMRHSASSHTRRAYIIRQFKRPSEIQALRRLYGEHFVVIAAYSDKKRRIEKLCRLIGESENSMDYDRFESRASALVTRDEDEEIEHGQKLRDTFWRADLFVDPSQRQPLASSIRRFIDLLFGLTISTPTRDEAAMFTAWGASMRSASMARQVGACLIDSIGSVVATGTNEVPQAFGGVYWEGDQPDGRDHHKGWDESDLHRGEMIAQVFDELKGAGWLSKDLDGRSAQELTEEVLGSKGILKRTRAAGVMEYVRAVHAEQCALADAARRGVPTSGLTMAVTTFPCHECARLIVAAGIKELCYVEPYSKSLAKQMYGDSISFDSKESGKILFRPYLGVAPQIYSRLFSSEGVNRKDVTGKLIVPDAASSTLRLTYQGSRLRIEEAESTYAFPLLDDQKS